MKLLIKQRVFSWTDTYDVYDGNENCKYFVKAKFLSLGHRLHIFDKNDIEIGVIKEKLLTIFPAFEIEINGRDVGKIQKKFNLLLPKYEVDFNGWKVEGDLLGWNYHVVAEGRTVMHISKELLHWGDTYVIDFSNPSDEVMGLLLVIAIDAANCSDSK